MVRRLSSLLLLSSSMLAFVGLAACGSGGSGEDLVDNGFESDDPAGKTAAQRGDTAGGADAGAASAEPSSGAEKNDSAQRAVEEADILKVDGNRLYALSRYGGLAIVDISNPDALKLLGRKRTDGIPFEMYVKNGRAYVMLNEFGRYVREPHELYGQWVQSSEILAFDVSDPANVKDLAHYDVPGSIADSRVVGDALYLVTYENGYCWKCSQTPSTIVTSFGIGGTSINKVDQLTYSAQDKNYSGWQRSVSATNERLYIAGPEWNWMPNQTNNGQSIIQVVDIKDPTGKLVKGADIAIAGQINSRWQMDEHNGVLRVVSQFGNGWWGPNNSIDPVVQTFTVTNSQSIAPLGKTTLKLPKPESLRSVRFDGTRGYAITAERTDPLFTIDLADPAAPKQAGELEMPGWIFHMEPRGDRLVGFGYEDTNWNSRLAVSLFDVSDLTKPTMLKRVPFGKGRGNVAEDQDRIHKSVRVLDEQGLILVPFASYGSWFNGNCEKGESGIQIIDYSKNDLVLRGIAPQWGMPRRAFLANDRLFAISDRNVSTFDIASKDAPLKKSELDLSNPAYKMAALPNHIASITNDWWSGEVMLSLTPKENADDASIIGKVSLAALAEPTQALCSSRNGWTSWYSARLAVNGNMVYVAVPTYTYSYEPNTKQSSRGGRLSIAAVDVSDPAKPVMVGKADVAMTEHTNDEGYWGFYGDGFWDGYGYYSHWSSSGGALVGSGTGLVQLGSKLAYLEVDYEPYKVELNGQTRYEARIHRKLHVVDMASPTAPVINAPIHLGESYGATPLHLSGSTVLTSRWIRSEKNPDKVRFFVDRVDIGGNAPVRLSSINTPGSLLQVDEQSSRFVTTDYIAERNTNTSSQDCYKWAGGRARWDYDTSTCVKVTRSFKLADVAGTTVTLRDTFTPPSQNLGGVQLAEDRIFVTRFKQYDYSTSTPYENGRLKVLEDGGLWAIGGIRDGKLAIVSEMKGDAQWPLAAKGTKIALYTEGGLEILDTSTATPKKLLEANLRGYGYSSHVLLEDNKAVCSLGEWGIQTIGF